MNGTKTIDPNQLSVPELHSYLLAAVAPRPIAFASTVDKQGNVNLSPFSYFNVFSANPPILIFSPANRARDNTSKHTYENVKAVPQAVINIVNHPLVEQMSLSSTEYDRGVNEFIKAGLTEVPADKVKPPRVGEAPVAFECEVDQIIELGNEGGAGNLVISRIVMIHIQEKYLDKNGKLDTTALDLVGRMGGNWYCRASGDALFEIPKPLTTKGIGIDQLPESIRTSKILTGNNLGRLGNVEQFPQDDAIDLMREDAEVKAITDQYESDPEVRKQAMHQLAQNYLEQGNTEKALTILLVLETRAS